jgi:hypothetical protein
MCIPFIDEFIERQRRDRRFDKASRDRTFRAAFWIFLIHPGAALVEHARLTKPKTLRGLRRIEGPVKWCNLRSDFTNEFIVAPADSWREVCARSAASEHCNS